MKAGLFESDTVSMMCRLYLKEDSWKPLGLNAELELKHRNRYDDDIFTCYLIAEVGPSSVERWVRTDFVRKFVDLNGAVRALDLSVAAKKVEAHKCDALAALQGAHGVNVKLASRLREENTWEPSVGLGHAALELAQSLMVQRRNTQRLTGVKVLSLEAS